MFVMQVSESSKCVGNTYTQFPSTGVRIVWKWEPLKYDDSKDELGTEEVKVVRRNLMQWQTVW